MAWTSPMTFVANTALTAAQFNTFLRDNLFETAPARATTAGSMFVATGVRAIVERRIAAATVATNQSTTSTDFVDLSTIGPSVTLTTGTNALVLISCELTPVSGIIAPNGTSIAAVSFAVTGSSNITASTDRQLRQWQAAGGSDGDIRRCGIFWISGLTAGINTFTMKYALPVSDPATGGPTAKFADRHLIVMAF